MTKQEATDILTNTFIRKLGSRYHPDNPMEEYINYNGQPMFTPQEAEQLNILHSQVFQVLGNEIYLLGLQLLLKLDK